MFNDGAERITDLDLSLDMTKFRTYDPAVGRWLQVDPAADQLSDFTPYNYSFNNPIRYNDPLGDCPFGCDPFFQIGVVKGAYNAIKSTVTNTVDFLSNGGSVEGRINFGINTIRTAKAVANNPGAVVDAAVDGVKNTANTLVNGTSYEQGEIVGALGVAVIDVALGSKGMGNTAKVVNAVDEVSDAAKVVTNVSSEIVENIGEGGVKRIQNAANRINEPISLVGSRASGTAKTTSDFDYVIGGVSSKKIDKIKNSLPGAPSRVDNQPRRIDFFKGEVDTSKPYITINPEN